MQWTNSLPKHPRTSLHSFVADICDTDTLVVDERIREDGSLLRTYLQPMHGSIRVFDDDGLTAVLPMTVLLRVMERYGKPLDPTVCVPPAALRFRDGVSVQALRYHARVDAESRNYLILSRPDHSPVAALATVVASAMRHFVGLAQT